MINWIRCLFINDWIKIETFASEWYTFNRGLHGELNNKKNRKTFFIIEYSHIRNKFRITTDGETNESTFNGYEDALKKLGELNILLITHNIDYIFKKYYLKDEQNIELL